MKSKQVGSEGSDGIQRILQSARSACLNKAGVNAYLSRASSLVKKFQEAFPDHPEVSLLRAPGRVNLIGEHTDYNGLPVLPIALNRDIMLACSPRNDSTVIISNTNPRFESRRFEISDRIEPYRIGDWGNYAKAAVQVLQDSCAAQSGIRGFNAYIDGTIPIAGGLSSSSALVVAFALAALSASGRSMDKAALAEMLSEGEHYVGTRGGGMDQTICLLAEEGKALKIDFFPTRAEAIPLPSTCSFVVCDSMVAAPKTSTARFGYNLRATESRIAAAALNAALIEEKGKRITTTKRLGDLYAPQVGLSEAEIDELAEKALFKEIYGVGETAGLLKISVAELRNAYFDTFSDKEFESIEYLNLRARCRHVLSEGRRVRLAAEALRKNDPVELGRLMNESHKSCANDYEISTPELDALVSIARDAGALGSRLTGAGFGGCTVSLVRDSNIAEFRKAMERRYYGEYLSPGCAGKAGLSPSSERILICKATPGAGVLFTFKQMGSGLEI
jgi:N-acetylgalactosamine kinase